MPDATSTPPPAEDEFDRALRELTENPAGSARFHEPSAAERARAAAKRAELVQRRTEQASQHAKLTRAAKKQFRRRWAGEAVAWTAAIALVAGGLAVGWRHFGGLTKGSPNDTGLVSNGSVPSSASPGALVPSGALTSGALSSGIPADGGPPANPFATTEAAHWANGAAGIVLPVPEPVGSFTAAQVEAAYGTTRNLLIAQNLDRTTLLGGAPTAFANLLDPKQRAQFMAGLNKIGVAKDGAPLSSRAWVASFAPGTTVLIGSVIKVHGTMSAREVTAQGSKVLDIHVNYRFAYAVEPPSAPQDWMRVVGQLDGYIQFTNWDSDNGSLLPWVTSAFPSEAGGRCAMADGYIHPDYPDGPPDKVKPGGKPIDPYSMTVPQPAKNSTCTATTGT
ncbi:MAG TPA: hypothetical protein VHZ03_16710 [Trebonia sp.]|nr:hypothetical protein [Trebonia sp.]